MFYMLKEKSGMMEWMGRIAGASSGATSMVGLLVASRRYWVGVSDKVNKKKNIGIPRTPDFLSLPCCPSLPFRVIFMLFVSSWWEVIAMVGYCKEANVKGMMCSLYCQNGALM